MSKKSVKRQIKDLEARIFILEAKLHEAQPQYIFYHPAPAPTYIPGYTSDRTTIDPLFTTTCDVVQ